MKVQNIGGRVSILALLVCMVFTAQSQQNMNLLGTWSDPTLPGSFQYNNTYNEVWGIAVNDHEYAIIGSTMGTHFIDVTDPTNIFEAFFVPGADQGGVIIHRDYHDYQGYLYAVADEGESTLQIMDISNLPNEVTVVSDNNDIIEQAHNIFIDEEVGKLYVLAAKGGDSGYKAMKIYSLEDPLDPKKIGQYGVIGGEGFGHVHDLYAKNDKAFMNCGFDGLFIVDFSGDDPVLLDRYSNADYPESGYNHSGWADEDMEYYYFADETHGSAMKTLKINDFSGTEIVGTFDAGNDSPFSIAHNQIVHDGYLYVSYYYDGVQVYKLDNQEAPCRVASYATSSIDNRDNYEGAWGVYPMLPSGIVLVSDMQEGLFVFEGIDVECSGPVANEEVELLGTRVFPNPTTDEVIVELDKTIDDLKLFDLQGTQYRLNWNQVGSQTLVILPESAGMYILQITADGSTISKKVSKLEN